MSFETDDAVLEQVGYRLMGQGVYFESVEHSTDRIEIDYETVAPGEGVPHRQIGRVITVFRDAIEEGWEPTTIEARVHDSEDGTLRGTWHMNEEWLYELESGDLSEVEFSGQVLETLEEPRS
ncbi:hypothetical protein [Halalkalicoccus jeotgali]|uniref:DUF8159 domain-containing protein n=1 Tax=Halalkalicoccus jeotgali (strain DSM 18796 / CECT 7217 / JCM 14584 / KCTC 4019 / B3) TaxID=795797 RepID=D8J3Z9_HALJB|nr:hypothetical protein [Halalkalicoccus jeotgali]ADJ15391.1 hypothetical protein HacjB3_10040 [Halalkalicoccus jeotgali B3]ELY35833.1 hypothetical protein C497_12631 [Halalkalicoccus jeotgali B3]